MNMNTSNDLSSNEQLVSPDYNGKNRQNDKTAKMQ